MWKEVILSENAAGGIVGYPDGHTMILSAWAMGNLPEEGAGFYVPIKGNGDGTLDLSGLAFREIRAERFGLAVIAAFDLKSKTWYVRTDRRITNRPGN